MDEQERQQRLFEGAMREIRKLWKTRTGLKPFVNAARDELRYIRYDYMEEASAQTAAVVDKKVTAAATLWQLVLTTKLEPTTFSGYAGRVVRIYHEGTGYAEVFIGPTDEWDRVMCFLPARRHSYGSSNPYTKKRLRFWKTLADFDFDALMASIKAAIDKPPEPEPVYDDDGDDIAF